MKYIYLFIITTTICSCDKSLLDSSANSNLNGTGGSLARFTLAGNYLYLIESNNLKTFDVSNPASPLLKSTLAVGNGVETIYPYKNNLLIGSQTGMLIYTLNDPVNPAFSGMASHVRSCDPVVANDTAAFVTLRGSGLCGAAKDGVYLYNVSSLLNPQLVKVIDLSSPFGLGLKDSTLFVCRGTNGLSVIDVRNISEATEKQTITGHDFRDVIPYNDLLICYVADGLALYNIEDVNNIRFIKKLHN